MYTLRKPQGKLLLTRLNTAVFQNGRYRKMGVASVHKRGELHNRDGTVTPATKGRNGASATLSFCHHGTPTKIHYELVGSDNT